MIGGSSTIPSSTACMLSILQPGVMQQIDQIGWDKMCWGRGFTLLHWAAKHASCLQSTRAHPESSHTLSPCDLKCPEMSSKFLPRTELTCANQSSTSTVQLLMSLRICSGGPQQVTFKLDARAV